MPAPIFDQHTDETPSSSETTAAFNATLQTFTADLEAQMQAIVAESTATMVEPSDDKHTIEILNTPEATAALNAILQSYVADSEARIQAAIAESTAITTRLDEKLQAILDKSKAAMDAIIAETKSFKIEELLRQPNTLSASSSSLSAGLEVVVTEIRDLPAAPQQKPLLYTTGRDGSLQPVSPSFWGDLLRLRRAFDETATATAIEFKSPKGPQ